MKQSNFLYQIICPLDPDAPKSGDLVYADDNWVPHMTLKRRFATPVDETNLINTLEQIVKEMSKFSIDIGKVTKDNRLPVTYLNIQNHQQIRDLHLSLHGALLSLSTEDKFPEREGDQFFPHITYTYKDKVLFDASDYESKTITVDSLWLIKDGDTVSDTRFLHKLSLR